MYAIAEGPVGGWPSGRVPAGRGARARIAGGAAAALRAWRLHFSPHENNLKCTAAPQLQDGAAILARRNFKSSTEFGAHADQPSAAAEEPLALVLDDRRGGWFAIDADAAAPASGVSHS